jgi:hypothetical protein
MTAACPGMRLTITAAGEPAPFKQAPGSPSLRSKRGIEQFRRTDNTYARPIRRRGAPMSPTGAAITLEALSTGLRQCLVRKHKTCNCRLSRAVQTRYGRDLLQIATGRVREAGESTVIDDTAGGATHPGQLRNTVGGTSALSVNGEYSAACSFACGVMLLPAVAATWFNGLRRPDVAAESSSQPLRNVLLAIMFEWGIATACIRSMSARQPTLRSPPSPAR